MQELRERDVLKAQYCIDNDICLLRISYIEYIGTVLDEFFNMFVADTQCFAVFSNFDPYQNQIRLWQKIELNFT